MEGKTTNSDLVKEDKEKKNRKTQNAVGKRSGKREETEECNIRGGRGTCSFTDSFHFRLHGHS